MKFKMNFMNLIGYGESVRVGGCDPTLGGGGAKLPPRSTFLKLKLQ